MLSMKRLVMMMLIALSIISYLGMNESSALAQPRAYTPPAIVRDTASFLIFNAVTIGPWVTGGVSQMRDKLPDDSWKSETRLAYTFGLTSYFSVSKLLGFTLGLEFDTRDHYAHQGDSVSALYELSYIDIQPSLRLFWLIVGLSIDLPTSGQVTEKIDVFDHLGLRGSYSQNRDITGSEIAGLTELHAALDVPVVTTASGDFHLVASARYPLGKLLNSAEAHDSTGRFGGVEKGGGVTGRQNLGQGSLLTLQAGFTFQFDLLH